MENITMALFVSLASLGAAAAQADCPNFSGAYRLSCTGTVTVDGKEQPLTQTVGLGIIQTGCKNITINQTGSNGSRTINFVVNSIEDYFPSLGGTNTKGNGKTLAAFDGNDLAISYGVQYEWEKSILLENFFGRLTLPTQPDQTLRFSYTDAANIVEQIGAFAAKVDCTALK